MVHSRSVRELQMSEFKYIIIIHPCIDLPQPSHNFLSSFIFKLSSLRELSIFFPVINIYLHVSSNNMKQYHLTLAFEKSDILLGSLYNESFKVDFSVWCVNAFLREKQIKQIHSKTPCR